jgi:hypothetical protein
VGVRGGGGKVHDSVSVCTKVALTVFPIFQIPPLNPSPPKHPSPFLFFLTCSTVNPNCVFMYLPKVDSRHDMLALAQKRENRVTVMFASDNRARA